CTTCAHSGSPWSQRNSTTRETASQNAACLPLTSSTFIAQPRCAARNARRRSRAHTSRRTAAAGSRPSPRSLAASAGQREPVNTNRRGEAAFGVFNSVRRGQVGENRLGERLRVDLRVPLHDLAVRPDHAGDTAREPRVLVVGGAVRDRQRPVRVAEQRERERVLVLERLVVRRRVERDTEQDRVLLRELLASITEAASLDRSTGRVGLGVEPEHDRLAAVVGEFVHLAGLVRRREVGRRPARRDHRAHRLLRLLRLLVRLLLLRLLLVRLLRVGLLLLALRLLLGLRRRLRLLRPG